MTKERVIEMVERIIGMHGFDYRKEQRFFFDGKIFYYNMIPEVLGWGTSNAIDVYDIQVRTDEDICWNISVAPDGKIHEMFNHNLIYGFRAPKEL